MSKKTVEEIGLMALNEESPEELEDLECLLYYRLRDIYRGFKAGNVSQDKGKIMKNKAVRAYTMAVKNHESDRRLIQNHAQLWRDIEEASRTYAGEHTLENADRFVEAVYGVKLRIQEKENQIIKEKEEAAGNDLLQRQNE